VGIANPLHVWDIHEECTIVPDGMQAIGIIQVEIQICGGIVGGNVRVQPGWFRPRCPLILGPYVVDAQVSLPINVENMKYPF
jgi:hypothetical protein